MGDKLGMITISNKNLGALQLGVTINKWNFSWDFNGNTLEMSHVWGCFCGYKATPWVFLRGGGGCFSLLASGFFHKTW